MEGFFYLSSPHLTKITIQKLTIRYLPFNLVLWYKSWYGGEKQSTMTIILFITLLLLTLVVYKSIDWFEKI